MSTAPSEAHLKAVAAIRYFETANGSNRFLLSHVHAARLLADSEARAVEADRKLDLREYKRDLRTPSEIAKASMSLADMRDKMIEYKSHYQYREQRVVELEQSLAASRERVRVLEEALRLEVAENIKLHLAAKAECDLNRTRLASIFWSGAMDKFTGGDVQKWAADYTAELARLRAEVERLMATLSSIEEDGTVEHNSAVGLRQKLVAATARAERAELESAGRLKVLEEKAEEARREWLRAERAESALAAARKPDAGV